MDIKNENQIWSRNGNEYSENRSVVIVRAHVVDDSGLDRWVVAEGIRRSCPGADIWETGRGEDAIKLLREMPFNVIVTDLIMEGPIDGLKIIVFAKKMLPRAGLVVVTNQKSTKLVVHRARGLGVRVVLQKPVDPEMVGRVCADMIQRRSLREKAREALVLYAQP